MSFLFLRVPCLFRFSLVALALSILVFMIFSLFFIIFASFPAFLLLEKLFFIVCRCGAFEFLQKKPREKSFWEILGSEEKSKVSTTPTHSVANVTHTCARLTHHSRPLHLLDDLQNQPQYRQTHRPPSQILTSLRTLRHPHRLPSSSNIHDQTCI